VRSTLRLLASLVLLVAAATGAFAAQAEISGIDKIYLRSGPGSEQPAIGILSAGDRSTSSTSKARGRRFRTADGKIGYVYHRYVTPRVGEDAAAAPTRQCPPRLR